MSEEEFRRELCYRAALSIAESLEKEGIISREECLEMEASLLKIQRPPLGTLLAGEPLE